jgi:N,N-dimethylformamidase
LKEDVKFVCWYPRLLIPESLDLQLAEEQGAYANNPAVYNDYGLSTYNYHSDGVAGICYASHKRPLFNLRPGYQTKTCSSLRHFSADSHLASWLHHFNIPYEIITDDELDREGVSAIRGYQCLMTGTLPEYQTVATMDALQQYLQASGNLAYLGANGFYWKIVRHPQHPSLLEIKRNEGGIRAWATEPGEYYSAFDGTYGGLWRNNDRPPQQLVSVGFCATSTSGSVPYQRVCYNKPHIEDWVFRGIENEKILGDFGLSGNGAAGFALDHVDDSKELNNRLFLDFTILAQSFHKKDNPNEDGGNNDNKFILVPEEVLMEHLS